MSSKIEILRDVLTLIFVVMVTAFVLSACGENTKKDSAATEKVKADDVKSYEYDEAGRNIKKSETSDMKVETHKYDAKGNPVKAEDSK